MIGEVSGRPPPRVACSDMPHSEQRAGVGETTSGCIGHAYVVAGALVRLTASATATAPAASASSSRRAISTGPAAGGRVSPGR